MTPPPRSKRCCVAWHVVPLDHPFTVRIWSCPPPPRNYPFLRHFIVLCRVASCRWWNPSSCCKHLISPPHPSPARLCLCVLYNAKTKKTRGSSCGFASCHRCTLHASSAATFAVAVAAAVSALWPSLSLCALVVRACHCFPFPVQLV